MKTFKQFKAVIPTRATGNPGFKHPYDQGVEHARKGHSYDNPYDQPGEEELHNEYRRGYDDIKNK